VPVVANSAATVRSQVDSSSLQQKRLDPSQVCPQQLALKALPEAPPEAQ
jgi:hypothetical protein